MAVRKPLYYVDPGDGNLVLQEMTSSQLNNIYKQAIKLMGYGPNTLTANTNNNSTDFDLTQGVQYWNLQSSKGDGVGGTDDFPTVNALTRTDTQYKKVNNVISLTANGPADTNNISFPVYFDGSNLRSMSDTDFIDTFCKPAIAKFVDQDSGYEGNHYTISTSETLTDYTQVVFVYQDYYSRKLTGFDESRDAILKKTYYLHRYSKTIDNVSYVSPLHPTNDGNIQQFSNTTFNNLLKVGMLYTASNVSGYRIRYQLGGDPPGTPDASTQMGSSIYDHYRSTTSTTATQKDDRGTADDVNDDIYYTLRYPTGGISIRRTYKLHLYRT